jgi:uncharacterized protein (UPF0276 family)
MNLTLPSPGFGIRLRITTHYEEISDVFPSLARLEILTENGLVDCERQLDWLDRIRADYPMVMHGMSLSIGSTDPLDRAYLRKVKALAERVQPLWISDGLCWIGIAGKYEGFSA